jgi:hypothetical protein
MHRDDLLGLDELAHCESRAFGVHREVASDAHEREIGLEATPDQRHVPEYIGVAGVVDLEPVLELDHVAHGRAAIEQPWQVRAIELRHVDR